MVLPLPSLQRNRSSSLLKATQTNPNAVYHVARQEKQSDMGIVDMAAATGHQDKCSLWYAQSAAKTPKYPSNHVKEDLYIAAAASTKTGVIS